MSALLKPMLVFRETFEEYAGKGKGKGKDATLSKAELSQLLKTELGMRQCAISQSMGKVFSDLDQDGDAVLKIEEFVNVVAELYKCCPEKFTEQCSSSTKSDFWEAVKTFLDVFSTHAAKEGCKETLTKTELVDLLKQGFFEGEELSNDEVEYFFNSMNTDGDQVVGFMEFVSFAAEISIIIKPPCPEHTQK